MKERKKKKDRQKEKRTIPVSISLIRHFQKNFFASFLNKGFYSDNGRILKSTQNTFTWIFEDFKSPIHISPEFCLTVWCRDIFFFSFFSKINTGWHFSNAWKNLPHLKIQLIISRSTLLGWIHVLRFWQLWSGILDCFSKSVRRIPEVEGIKDWKKKMTRLP